VESYWGDKQLVVSAQLVEIHSAGCLDREEKLLLSRVVVEVRLWIKMNSYRGLF